MRTTVYQLTVESFVDNRSDILAVFDSKEKIDAAFDMLPDMWVRKPALDGEGPIYGEYKEFDKYGNLVEWARIWRWSIKSDKEAREMDLYFESAQAFKDYYTNKLKF